MFLITQNHKPINIFIYWLAYYLNKVTILTGKTMTERRFENIESEVKEVKNYSIETSKAIAVIGEAMAAISKSSEDIARSVEEMQKDAAAAEQHRVNEKEHRDRIDKRIDQLIADRQEDREKQEVQLNSIYDRVREVENKALEKIAELKTDHATTKATASVNHTKNNSLFDKVWQAIVIIMGLVLALLGFDQYRNG